MVLLAILLLTFSGRLNGLAQSPAGQPIPQPKRVLMLFSEGKDVPGNLMMEQAVRTEMQKASPYAIEFLTEYLDATHFSGEKHFQQFQEYLGKNTPASRLTSSWPFPHGITPSRANCRMRCFRQCRWFSSR